MSTFRIVDEDVEMTIAYITDPEHIMAPRLHAWNQAPLIRWLIDLEQYKYRPRERCSATREQYDTIAVSTKCSIDAEMLSNMALYVLGKNLHIPDVKALFAEKLQMDLKEDDIEARILKYFARFNKIVGNFGLQNVMGIPRPKVTMR